ncbi:sigma-70 family RNA polymerase sigma factor [uncultured Jatrophihabitans sp.]|uniref:sigma-70 family RNA polymerase sigma factor n=1 Tax=uncultured Jatrophihabitans sp. TaxID=1610747 RepID=UPI0035CC9188
MTLALERPAAAPRSNEDELVRTHLPLVGHLVREMLARVPAQVRRDDLTSAGMLGLAAAARSFDPSKGAPFAAYAALRIRGALTDELRSMDWASRSVRTKAREVSSVRATLTQTLGRTPSSDEVAQTMAVSLRDLSSIAADVHQANITSLSALPVDDSGDRLPTHEDGPEALLLRREQLGYLRDAIAELPDRLRTVVEDYFFRQRRMVDIAADLGVTESRVSQMRGEAVALLRSALADTDTTAPTQDTTSAGVRGKADNRRQAALTDFAASVRRRSSVAGRLSATTLLADYCG